MLNIGPPAFADGTKVKTVPGRNIFGLCLAQWVSLGSARDLPALP